MFCCIWIHSPSLTINIRGWYLSLSLWNKSISPFVSIQVCLVAWCSLISVLCFLTNTEIYGWSLVCTYAHCKKKSPQIADLSRFNKLLLQLLLPSPPPSLSRLWQTSFLPGVHRTSPSPCPLAGTHSMSEWLSLQSRQPSINKYISNVFHIVRIDTYKIK